VEKKLEHVADAEAACSEALQLAREGGNHGQERRARVYKAWLDAQRVVLESRRRVVDARQIRAGKQAAEAALRNFLWELERDVQRDENLWNLTETKLVELQQMTV